MGGMSLHVLSFISMAFGPNTLMYVLCRQIDKHSTLLSKRRQRCKCPSFVCVLVCVRTCGSVIVTALFGLLTVLGH